MFLPSARHERRVGAFLVRAAWERRPEGPAYLLSSVMLLYLAGQCAYFSTHFPPHRIIGTRRVFPSPCGWIFSGVPEFQDSGSEIPLANRQQAFRRILIRREVHDLFSTPRPLCPSKALVLVGLLVGAAGCRVAGVWGWLLASPHEILILKNI